MGGPRAAAPQHVQRRVTAGTRHTPGKHENLCSHENLHTKTCGPEVRLTTATRRKQPAEKRTSTAGPDPSTRGTSLGHERGRSTDAHYSGMDLNTRRSAREARRRRPHSVTPFMRNAQDRPIRGKTGRGLGKGGRVTAEGAATPFWVMKGPKTDCGDGRPNLRIY